VILPPWAKGDPRLFVRKHLQALESAKVSENLHVWIDLIFGSKQMGEEAEKALNLFHPLTYEGAVDADKIDDEVQRTATIAQISSYGQTPARIFKKDVRFYFYFYFSYNKNLNVQPSIPSERRQSQRPFARS